MKNKINTGDIFIIPNKDERYSVGQVLSIEKEALNSVICSFYKIRIRENESFDPKDLTKSNLIAIQFVTPDLLNMNVWKVVGNAEPKYLDSFIELNAIKDQNFVGAKIVGSAIIRKFLDAYHGLEPWDMMHDIHYFDKLLISPKKKPEHCVLSPR